MTLTISRELVWQQGEADREAVFAWLRAHGIEPSETRSVVIKGDEVRAEVYLTDAQGKRFVGQWPNEAATAVRAVPLAHPLPDCLPEA